MSSSAKKKIFILFLLVLIASALFGGWLLVDKYILSYQTTGTIDKGQVVSVTDGDTMTIDINNNIRKVRLIGVNTPESVHPDSSKNTEEGITASNYTKAACKTGMDVWVEYDQSQKDQYNRDLVYLWISEVSSGQRVSMDDVKNKMLNGLLVFNKVAQPMMVDPNIKYAYIFQKLYDADLGDDCQINI